MSKLKELSSIVSSLNEDEIKTLQRYLHCFDTINESHEPKSERLLNLIIHNNSAELRLFEKKFTKQAFSMLVMRLYDKVLDTLTFDINVKRPGAYSDLGLARMTVRKRLLYIQTLGSKGQFSEILSLYQKIINSAKEFEFYDELLIAMYELHNLCTGVKLNQPLYESLDKDIQHFEEVRTQVKQAFRMFNSFLLAKSINPENKNQLAELEIFLPKLKTFFLISNSAQAGWFYYRLLIEYNQIKGNYVEGHAACIALLKLQQENLAIKTDSYFAITYRMISHFCMFLYNFDDALVSILRAQNLDKRFQQNIQSSKETEFFANFYKGNYFDARYTINELVEKSDPKGDTFIYSTSNYHSACCSFLMRDFKDVNKKLIETKEIEKDKEGWNISVRILSIMNQIENEEFDLADSRIESMRKHIERTMKEKDIRPRYVIILRILRDLVNNSFDFKPIWETRRNYFDLLANDQDETHRWKIMSPEMIRFDVWFEAKATDVSYQEVFNKRIETHREKEHLSQAV